MPLTPEKMTSWCQSLLGANPDTPALPLEDYLAAIPRLDSLGDVPSGTPVLVRGDVDAKPGPQVGEGDIRLRSMLETLEWGRARGWKQIIFGHIGRKPEGSLSKVAKRLEELLGHPVVLIEDWWDEATSSVPERVTQQIAQAADGSIFILENTRRYDVERLLWKAQPDDAARLAEPLARFANACAEKLASVYVNEALSAGSLDSSTTVVPAAMQRLALGKYVAAEFEGPMRRCLQTSLVVFSGLKIDKLDDLEAMIARGRIRRVIAAGSLAMALKKAATQLDGGDFSLGVAEDEAHRDKPYYIPAARIDQARRMISAGRASGVQFTLPVDFVLGDGRVSDTIGSGEQQFDVGPKTSRLFEEQVSEFIDQARQAALEHTGPLVAFHNGVFGMFEDPRFESGTKHFIEQLRRMTEAGIEVYVGGGEGGTALERYGKPDWVTHCFTAGGTVLNALGSQPVPYLVALKLAAEAR